MSLPDTKEHDSIVAVVDIETTMKCPVGNNKASPYWPENEVVVLGIQRLDETKPLMGKLESKLLKMPPENYLLVGNNFQFDLAYLLQKGALTREELAALSIWDTQMAEYLLTGQRTKFASLDQLATKYGGTIKDDRVATMFAAGKGADEVPTPMLIDYLAADLNNTELVFKQQFELALNRPMLPLVWSQMDARKATVEMVNNGMCVDREYLDTTAESLQAKIDLLIKQLQVEMDGLPLDCTLPSQLATALFGGTIKWEEQEEVGRYKNGKPKMKWVEKAYLTKGHGLLCADDWKGKNGLPLTNDGILEELTKEELSKEARCLIDNVRSYRELSKQLSTYFDGMRALIMPDGCIHGTINHTATGTGRLSSSEPNLQNLPVDSEGNVKRAFVSRWGDDGVIVDADYSQLELAVLGVLSGDGQLLADIASGVDVHSALFFSIHKRMPEEMERWKFKRCAFALVYGGGVKAIAAQGNCTEDEAKVFMKAFHTRYPHVGIWHTCVASDVKCSRVHTGEKDAATGLPIGYGYYTSPVSNRLYSFREWPNSEQAKVWRGELCSFSPTEMKNYPVQGTATADIVPLVLGKLFHRLMASPVLKNKCLLINTVHDNVVFDVHKDVLAAALVTIRDTMQDAPRFIKDTWGFDWPLPLKVGLSYGPNWHDQTKLDTTTLKEIA